MKRFAVVIWVWTLALLACTAVVIVAFVRLDVLLVRHFWDIHHFLSPLGAGFGATVLLSMESAVILVMVLARLVRGQTSPFGKTLTLACLASICAYGVNDHVLKVFFGVPNATDVMHGVRHAFNFWMGTEASSFPSGHMALAGAFAGVFIRTYRASVWPLSALLLLAASLMLVGGWHFLSDLIAGTFLGISAGMLAAEGRIAHSER